MNNNCDSIILVDRTVRPAYPDFVREIKFPKLELAGPGQFDVNKLEFWLHPNQCSNVVTGHEILQYLVDRELLEGCLGISDLLAIHTKGVDFFEKNIENKIRGGSGLVWAWKSVFKPVFHYVDYVFGLRSRHDEFELIWLPCKEGFSELQPALRFPR